MGESRNCRSGGGDGGGSSSPVGTIAVALVFSVQNKGN